MDNGYPVVARAADNDVDNRSNSSLISRLERRKAGEPEFRKRGRKPKSPATQTESPCESAESEGHRMFLPHDNSARFESAMMVSIVSHPTRSETHENPFEESQANFQELPLKVFHKGSVQRFASGTAGFHWTLQSLDPLHEMWGSLFDLGDDPARPFTSRDREWQARSPTLPSSRKVGRLK
jgi:hypothetical protein